jgi:type VI secretion system protein ImpC
MPGRIDFDFRIPVAKNPRQHRDAGPMRLLLMGEFSGTAGERPAISERRIKRIDIDNLEEVLSALSPRLVIENVAATPLAVTFAAFEDFHPDALYASQPLFDELCNIRQRLHQPAHYREAAAQFRDMSRSHHLPESVPGERRAGENDAATLARLLGKPVSDEPQPVRTAHSLIETIIHQTVAEHIVPAPDPGQQVYYAAVDHAIGDIMRAILHHPGFQAIEALWRGVHFLVNRMELDEDLQLFLLDVSEAEITADMQQADGQIERSHLYRLLVERFTDLPGAHPWSALVGLYTFAPSAEDTRTLAALGSLAACAGGPFLAGASPAILGARSLVETPSPRDWRPDEASTEYWNGLRESRAAPWLGLALPRLLLRLPYGEKTDSIESFSFEEMPAPEAGAPYLWGNPALACATLLAQAFTENGWSMRPGDVRDIGDLPAFSYTDGDEWHLLPCAESYLSETAAENILDHGLMPLLSIHNTNSVRLLRFQSIASPHTTLAGPWY